MTDANESWIETLIDALVSEYQRGGYFDRINTHEPRRKPGKGLTAAIWPLSITPLPLASGLNVTSALVVFTGRSYMNMHTEPNDMIDVWMLRANSNLMRAFSGDFTLGGLIRNVDLLGNFGTPLSLVSGYLDQDKAKFRIIDLTIPCVVNDVWTQAA